MMTESQTIVSRRPPVAALACLNLTVDNERKIAEVIQRSHSGTDASWRMLAVCRVGDLLYELAERVDVPPDTAQRFDVVTWELGLPGKIGIWFHAARHTHRSALRLYETLIGKTEPIGTL
jgi:hypothetical protein